MRGGMSSAAGQDTRFDIECRSTLKKAPCARSRHQRQQHWNRFARMVLLDGGEFGARPLRVDDELERVKLLVLLPQPVQRLTAKMRQGLARGVSEEPEVGEF